MLIVNTYFSIIKGEKKMKKLIFLSLMICACAFLSACGGSDEPAAPAPAADTAAQTGEEAAQTPDEAPAETKPANTSGRALYESADGVLKKASSAADSITVCPRRR